MYILCYILITIIKIFNSYNLKTDNKYNYFTSVSISHKIQLLM